MNVPAAVEKPDELVRLCDEAITAYLQKRGTAVYDHRRAALGYLSGNGRVRRHGIDRDQRVFQPILRRQPLHRPGGSRRSVCVTARWNRRSSLARIRAANMVNAANHCAQQPGDQASTP